MPKARFGNTNPHWKPEGSSHIDDMGNGLRYRVIKHNGEWKREHRVIMEKKLGRPLKRTEHVHHIDGDGLNNSDENLTLMPQREHLSLSIKARMHNCPLCQHSHLPGRGSEYHVCPDCGRTHQVKIR